jgi:hypothetical protein
MTLTETSGRELKIEFRKECWFDPGQGHQSGTAGRYSMIPKSGDRFSEKIMLKQSGRAG